MRNKRDKFCSYYTNSKDITNYMISKLNLVNDDIILEPSAGEGIFIDEILKTNKKVQIDALDLNTNAISILKSKYKDNLAIKIRETDTLLDEELDIFSLFGGYYSKILGNPPYGAWQDFSKRDLLKKKFVGHYVKETYSLFLIRCLSILKNKGKLCFIIPDSFLFVNSHFKLRKLILTNSKIDEILIFPSKFFPGVCFNYSNLSIITLEKCEMNEALSNTFRIINGFKSPNEFNNLLKKEKEYSNNLQIFKLKQKDILKNDRSRVILSEHQNSILFTKSTIKLGDISNIVTGLYTGNNLSFIKAANKDIKGINKYDIVDQDKDTIVTSCTSINGILNPNLEEVYIPYIKGSSKRRYLKQDDWFIRWDKRAIDFYKNNKKSRFQNSSFYFKTGIGIPKIKSNIVRAFLMCNRVFDQSIVGIFPKDLSKIYYLLALMNSDTINNLIHTINPTISNTSNYVKQLPYIEPKYETFDEITRMVKQIITFENSANYENADKLHNEINFIIKEIYCY